MPLPLRDHRIGDFEHHPEIAAHRAVAEGGEEDVVRLGPVGLVGEAGEEPVAREAADGAQPGAGDFAETALVAQLRHEIGVRDPEADIAAEIELEDAGLREIARDSHQMLDQPGLGDLVEVADDRQRLGRRNLRFAGHVSPRFPGEGLDGLA